MYAIFFIKQTFVSTKKTVSEFLLIYLMFKKRLGNRIYTIKYTE